MKFFDSIRPLVRIASELRRIASALEYFAVADARDNNRMYHTQKTRFTDKDESELMHTNDSFIRQRQEDKLATFLQGGAKRLEEEEDDVEYSGHAGQ